MASRRAHTTSSTRRTRSFHLEGGCARRASLRRRSISSCSCLPFLPLRLLHLRHPLLRLMFSQRCEKWSRRSLHGSEEGRDFARSSRRVSTSLSRSRGPGTSYRQCGFCTSSARASGCRGKTTRTSSTMAYSYPMLVLSALGAKCAPSRLVIRSDVCMHASDSNHVNFFGFGVF